MEPIETLMNIRKSLHELSQPLTVAMGFIYLISLELDGNPQINRDLIKVNDQLKQIKKIAQYIQDITRAATRDKVKL
jgi:hypothetical protein